MNNKMNNKIRIGIYYKWKGQWIGGFYYIKNLLVALNTLEDGKKPIVDFYCYNFDLFQTLKKESEYPFLVYNKVNSSFFLKVVRKICRHVNEKWACKIGYLRFRAEDLFVFLCDMPTNVKVVNWKPDFQEKYLPELFSEKELKNREFTINVVGKNNIPLVFSSYSSLNDYKRFYPHFSNKTFVLHFGVNHPDFSSTKIEDVLCKYGISTPYLLCANQFWKHKNHLFLFKAYAESLKRGLKMQLVCSGSFSDYRNPEYIDEIKHFIKSNCLEDKILTLGLIEHKELLCLMKNSYAVVQPSLFEGWNTTVEDCKLLSKFVFLSDLEVHREQMSKNVCFFNPHDINDLSQKLLTVKPIEEKYEYSHSVNEFVEGFQDIVKYMQTQVK